MAESSKISFGLPRQVRVFQVKCSCEGSDARSAPLPTKFALDWLEAAGRQATLDEGLQRLGEQLEDA